MRSHECISCQQHHHHIFYYLVPLTRLEVDYWKKDYYYYYSLGTYFLLIQWMNETVRTCHRVRFSDGRSYFELQICSFFLFCRQKPLTLIHQLKIYIHVYCCVRLSYDWIVIREKQGVTRAEKIHFLSQETPSRQIHLIASLHFIIISIQNVSLFRIEILLVANYRIKKGTHVKPIPMLCHPCLADV